MGNGVCDEICNTSACNDDNGDCVAECTPGCSSELLNNNQCDLDCFNSDCAFDSLLCLAHCSEGCLNDQLGDGNCQPACFTPACGYDAGDCPALCEVECLNAQVGDGVCDSACVSAACNFDGGDCTTTAWVGPGNYSTIREAFLAHPEAILLDIVLASGHHALDEDIALAGGEFLRVRGECSDCSALTLNGSWHTVQFDGFKKVWLSDLLIDGSQRWVSGCNEPTCMFARSWECVDGVCTNCRGDELVDSDPVLVMFGDACNETAPLVQVTNSVLELTNVKVTNLDQVSNVVRLSSSSADITGLSLDNVVLRSYVVQADAAESTEWISFVWSEGSEERKFQAAPDGYSVYLHDLSLTRINEAGCFQENPCRLVTTPGILKTDGISLVVIDQIDVDGFWYFDELSFQDESSLIQTFKNTRLVISNLAVRNAFFHEYGLMRHELRYAQVNLLAEFNIEIRNVTVSNVYMHSERSLFTLNDLEYYYLVIAPAVFIDTFIVSEFKHLGESIIDLNYKEFMWFLPHGEPVTLEYEGNIVTSFVMKGRNISNIMIQNSPLPAHALRSTEVPDVFVDGVQFFNCSQHLTPPIVTTLGLVFTPPECESLLLIEGLPEVGISNVNVEQSECCSGPVFDIRNTTELLISGVFVSNSSANAVVEFNSIEGTALFELFTVSSFASQSQLLSVYGNASAVLSNSFFVDTNATVVFDAIWELHISDVQFVRNRPDSSVVVIAKSVPESQTTIANSLFQENTGIQSVDLYVAQGPKLHLNVVHTEFTGTSGSGPVSIAFASGIEIGTVTFTSCHFSDMHVEEYRGVIAINFKEGSVLFDSCEFIENSGTVTTYAPIVFLQFETEQQFANFTNCRFASNTCQALISQQNVYITQHLFVSGSIFEDNASLLLELLNAIVVIESTTLSRNRPGDFPLVLAQGSSTLVVDSVLVIANQRERDPLIKIGSNSELVLSNSQFKLNEVADSSLLSVQNSVASVYNMEVYDNICDSGLLVLYSNASITDCITIGNQSPHTLLIQWSTAEVQGGHFTEELLALSSEGATLVVTSGMFDSCVAGISAVDSTVTISDSSFQATHAPVLTTGSAIEITASHIAQTVDDYFLSESNVYLYNVSFLETSGRFSTEDSTVILDDVQTEKGASLFFYRSTVTATGISAYHNQDTPLVFETSELTLSDSNFRDNAGNLGGGINLHQSTASIHSSLFEFNSAEAGGAIYHTNSSISLAECSFRNNSAVYGDDFATNPVRLLTMSEFPEGLRSGAILEDLVFYLVDEYDQTIATDYSSLASLEFLTPATVFTGTTSALAVQGVFTFTDVAVFHTPTSWASLIVSASDVESFQSELYFRSCEPGEVPMSDNSCYLCGNSTYSLTVTDTFCEVCPPEGLCLGGNEIYPKAGYWRANVNESVFYTCPNPLACAGGTTSLQGDCSEGYTGVMCAVCVDGHRPGAGYKCSQCPTDWVSYLFIGISVLVILLFVIVMVIVKMRSANRKPSDIPLLLKMLMNYLQTVMLFSAFNISWPSLTSTFLNFSSMAGNPSAELVSLRCSDTSFVDMLDISLQEIVLMNLFPFMILAVSALFWGVLACVKRKKQYLTVSFVATIVILVFFLHSSVTSSLLSLFGCRDIGSSSWMTSDYSVKCWTNEHELVAIYLGIPGLLLWCIVIPIVAIYLLVRNRGKLEDERTQLKYKTLYSGYKPSFYFWEIVVLFRKMLIRTIAVVLVSFPTIVQGLAGVFVLCCMGYLQVIFNPFENQKINRLEFVSIAVCAFTLLCGVLYNQELGNDFEVALSYCVMIGNAVFFGMWACFMWKAALDKGKETKIYAKLNEKWNNFKEKIASSISQKASSSSAKKTAVVAPFNPQLNSTHLSVPEPNTYHDQTEASFTLRGNSGSG